MSSQNVDLVLASNVATQVAGAWQKIPKGGTYNVYVEASAWGGATAKIEREGPAGEGTGAVIPDPTATFTANGFAAINIGSNERIRLTTSVANPTGLYARLRLING